MKSIAMFCTGCLRKRMVREDDLRVSGVATKKRCGRCFGRGVRPITLRKNETQAQAITRMHKYSQQLRNEIRATLDQLRGGNGSGDASITR